MRERGFTYVGLLLLVAITSSGLAAAGSLWAIESRREKEAQLLSAGQEIARAITAFRDKTPAGQVRRFPRRLDELLDDRRWPTTTRHLRQVYVDPVTAGREWGIVRGPGDGIIGVYSLGTGVPLKQGNFPEGLESFAGATSYQEWRFVYSAPVTAAPAPN